MAQNITRQILKTSNENTAVVEKFDSNDDDGVLTTYEQIITNNNDTKNNSKVLVDTRLKSQYLTGHIPGAINIPLADVLAVVADADGTLDKIFGDAGIDKNTHCVFYDDIRGAVASRVANGA